MPIVGLITLLLTLVGVVYILTPAAPVVVVPDSSKPEEVDSTTYSEAISVAKDAVKTATERAGTKIEVYPGILVSSASTVVDLSGQRLTGSLKAEIRQLAALTELNLSNNQFTGVPAEIGQLRELRVLNLANNPLTGLPYELGNLQKLQTLDLRGTSYAEQDLAIITSKLPSTTTILVD